MRSAWVLRETTATRCRSSSSTAIGTPTIGFYQQRTHDVVAIDSCPIVVPQLSDYISRFNLARTNGETSAALQDAQHLVARSARATSQSVVTITTRHASEAAQKAAEPLLAQLPGAVGITNSFDLSSANSIMGRRHRLLAGSGEIEESIHGVKYRVSAGSFFQVNVEIVARIFAFMKSGLSKPRKIVDLYCGAGTFSLFFAKHGCEVLGIEENPQAVAEARDNAVLNGFEDRVSFRTGRVEEEAPGGIVRAGAAGSADRLSRPAAQGLRRGDARGDRCRGRPERVVSVLRSGHARPGFEVLGGQRIPLRRRAAIRHVPADGPRRDPGYALQRIGRRADRGRGGICGHSSTRCVACRRPLCARPTGVSGFCHPIRLTYATSPNSRESH